MKKIISVILAVFLLLVFSLQCLAVGNTYTFTSSWWDLIFDNLLLSNNNNDMNYNTSKGVLSIDGSLINSDYDYSSSAIWLEADGAVSSGLLTITIPLNLKLSYGVDTLSLDFYTAYSNSVQPISATFHSGNTDYSAIITTHDFDSVAFGNLNFPSSSATIANFNADYTGQGQLVNLTYNKSNSDVYTLEIDSVSIIFRSTGSTFCLGVPCIDSLVTLPDYLYNDIANIKQYSRQIYSYFGILNSYVLELQEQISDLTDLIGNSGSSTENYYNTIINESPEQAEKLAALQAELEQAKQDLADFQEKFNSYDPPVPDEVLPDEEVTQITIDSLNNEDTSVVYGLLFGNELFLGILVMTLSIATIGYILYGKRA